MKTEKVIWTPQIVKYMVHLINKQEYTSIEIACFISEKFQIYCNKNQVISKAIRIGLNVRRKEKKYTIARSKFWTLEKKETLMQMWEENVPVGDIGYKLGISGSNVARAAASMGLPKRDLTQVRHQSTRMKIKMKAPPKAPGTISIERTMDKFLNPNAKKLKLVDLQHNSCRYIVGDTMTPDYRYCGAEVPVGYPVPYCEVCRKIVYYPARLQQKIIDQENAGKQK